MFHRSSLHKDIKQEGTGFMIFNSYFFQIIRVSQRNNVIQSL